jgi:hypothetical protein
MLSGLDWSRENNGKYTSHSKLRSPAILEEEHSCLQSYEKRGGKESQERSYGSGLTKRDLPKSPMLLH